MPDINLLRLVPFQFESGDLTNIVPFTYRDGLTFLELIESLRDYLNNTVIPAINNYKKDDNAETKLNEKLAEITKTFNENMTRIEAGDKASQDELTKAINKKIGDTIIEVNRTLETVNASLTQKKKEVEDAVENITPTINTGLREQNAKIEKYKTDADNAFQSYKSTIDGQVESIKNATGISIVRTMSGNTLSPGADWPKTNPILVVMERPSLPFTVSVTGFIDHVVKKTFMKQSEWPAFIALPLLNTWHLFGLNEFDPNDITIPPPYTPPAPNFTEFSMQRMNIETERKFTWFVKKTAEHWKIEDQYVECITPGLYNINIDIAVSGTAGTWGSLVYATALVNATAVKTHWYMRSAQLQVRMSFTKKFSKGDRITIGLNAQDDGLSMSATDEYSLMTATLVR